MNMTHFRCIPLLLVPLALAACDVFDARLEALARPDMAMSAADMTSTTFLALADRCSGDVPTFPSEPDEFDVDTTNLANDISTDITSCTTHPADGNDGFFAIDTTAGQRWHFHVHPLTSSVDVALYILPTCDERSCTVAHSEDECGPGRDEHLSFIAPNSGHFLVGIDSRSAGGSPFHVLAVRPVCGNGILEHSESCDDGNVAPGDGCDEHCRSELSVRATSEVEPNDDAIGANVLLLDSTAPSLTVHGRLGGRCDFDTYAIQVPVNGSVQATLLDVTGNTCSPTTPAMSLTFLLPDGHTVAGVVKGSDGAGCPAIGPAQPFANALPNAGTYFVRVSTNADVPTAFDYSLQFQLH
jgi:cysteine-rich repeat protein